MMYIIKTFKFRICGIFLVEIHSEQRNNEGTKYKHFCNVWFGFKHQKTKMFGFHWRTEPNNIYLGYGTTKLFQRPNDVGETKIIELN